MARLIDKIEERERQQISAKVNSKTYAAFTEINRALGMSNNSALNMIIADYVREKRYVLEDIK